MSHFIQPSYDYCPNCGAKTKAKEIEGQDVKVCAAKCGFAGLQLMAVFVALALWLFQVQGAV